MGSSPTKTTTTTMMATTKTLATMNAVALFPHALSEAQGCSSAAHFQETNGRGGSLNEGSSR
jgi:hypothetical protein